MRALLAAAGCEPSRLDEGDLAFRLGPRINAAGRLYRADAGVELFLTADEARAEEIATELNRANGERRGAEREVDAGAEAALRALPEELREAPGFVLAGQGWHPGVIGIVASRMVERHHLPVVVDLPRRGGRGPRLGAQHPRLRPAGGARGLLGASGRIRRAPGRRRAGAAGRGPRCVSRRLRRACGRGARAGRPAPHRAHRRDGRRRRPRPRPRRGARAAGSVRDREPRGAAAGSLRPRPRRAHDGRGEPARALQPPQRRPPGPGRRLRQVEPRGRRRRSGRRRGAARGEPLERRGRAAGRAARALPAQRRPSAPESRREMVGALRGRAGERPRRVAAEPGRREGTSGAPLTSANAPAAVVGELASSGESVLAVGRRRAGCGPRCRSSGIELADYAELERDPELPGGFAHVVLVDPPPFAHLEEPLRARGGGGFLHLAWGEAEWRFASAPSASSSRGAQRWSPSSGTCATPARRAARPCWRRCAARGRGRARPRRRRAASGCWPSSASCGAAPTAATARSGSYPQRGPIWSARPRSAPIRARYEEGQRYLEGRRQP